MKDNNNDPIQENKAFRFGLDDLTGNDTINSNDDYSDLHDCSDDLSDRGSRKEEYEHAKFAESKRRNSYNYSYSNYGKKQVVLLDKNKKIITYIIVFFFIILPILQAVLGIIITTIGFISSEFVEEVSNEFGSRDYASISSENSSTNLVADLETQRDNIVVASKMLENKELIIETQNTSTYTMLDIKLQIIFYDGENKPIHISDMNISTLFANQKNIQKLYNVPESFERYDFLITQPYKSERPTVNYNDIALELINDNNSYLTFEVTNNTNENLNDVEIAILGYSGDKLVSLETRSVWEIKLGKSKETNIYVDSTVCDRIEYFVNDIYCYK